MSDFNDIRSAYEGTFVLNAAAELVLNVDAYFITADAVITKIEVNEATGPSVLGSYVWTPAGTVPAGTWLIAKNNDFFSAITLASGTLTAYTKKPLPDGT